MRTHESVTRVPKVTHMLSSGTGGPVEDSVVSASVSRHTTCLLLFVVQQRLRSWKSGGWSLRLCLYNLASSHWSRGLNRAPVDGDSSGWWHWE